MCNAQGPALFKPNGTLERILRIHLVFSSFVRAHAQAMSEYRGGKISTEVVVDRNLWTEIVDRRRK